MNSNTSDILNLLLDPIGRSFTPEVAKKVANMRVDQRAKRRLNHLAGKCNEGEMTEAERKEYETYVNALDLIGVLQMKARSILRRDTGSK